LLPGQSSAEEFSTLVHELAHKTERRTATTNVVRETEAKAIAFVVGKAVGLEKRQRAICRHRVLGKALS
jgi:flagellar motor switch protein FliG